MKAFRLLPSVAATAALVLAAGCSSSTEADPASTPSNGAFPVTIDHTFGSTEVAAEPRRIITMGWNASDILGALDITPVGQPLYEYGADDNGVMPWAQQFYDGDATTLYADPAAGEPSIEEIATLEPDLVLAPYEGFDRSYYDTLSH